MTIYVSKALAEKFPKIASLICYHAMTNGIEYRELDSGNLWARDYMPVKTKGDYTKFQYKGYDGFPQLEVKEECWDWIDPYWSDIVLDGGNVEQNDTTVLMTEQVFKNNPNILRKELGQFLKDIFGKKIIFLPVEPGDELGHIDGIARFIDEKTVFINDYGTEWPEYSRKLERILEYNCIKFIRMPWGYSKMPKITETEFRIRYPYADDYNPAAGYYINYLETPDMIFLPSFGFEPEDMESVKIIKQHFPDREVVQIECLDLSMHGGVLNCITWCD